MFRTRIWGVAALIIVCVCLTNVQAGMLDLSATGVDSGTINGAWFYNSEARTTGSGTIHSFVRIGSNDPVEEGYNTSGRPTQYDENSSPTFTHSLQLGTIPIVNLGGVNYREFMLDINQTGDNPLLSLDKLQLYIADVGDFTGTIGTSPLVNPLYDLDTGGDNWIELDFSLGHGSGSGDMLAYIRSDLFGTDPGKFVYLYSEFGENFPNNDGFEEWAWVEGGSTVVPLPGAALLGLLGLGAAGLRLRRVV